MINIGWSVTLKIVNGTALAVQIITCHHPYKGERWFFFPFRILFEVGFDYLLLRNVFFFWLTD